MSLDLKTEVFSVDVFRYLWYRLKITKILLPRPRNYECETVPDSCVQKTVHASWIRNTIFRSRVAKMVEKDLTQFSKSVLDFYLFIKNNVEVFTPHREMIIFDKLLMSLALVSEMGVQCDKNKKQFIYHTPICWALFFDSELSEEFFAKGGWDELEKRLTTYTLFNVHDREYMDDVCGCTNDLSVIKCLFACRTHFYNLEILKNYFKQIYSERVDKNTIACIKCFPLYIALKCLSFAEEPVCYEAILVEGYLQLILLIIEFKEIKSLAFDIIKEFEKNAQFNNLTKPELIKEILNLRKGHHMSETFKGRATDSYLEHIFVDQPPKVCTESIFSDSTDEKTCIFCDEDVNQHFKALQKSEKKISIIKSAIFSTIKKVSDPEHKYSLNLSDITFDDALNLNAETLNLNKFLEYDRDARDALHMFHVLGVEPGRTNMLKVLKNKNHEGKSIKNGKLDRKKKIKK